MFGMDESEIFVPLEMFSTHISMDSYDEDDHYSCSVWIMKSFGWSVMKD